MFATARSSASLALRGTKSRQPSSEHIPKTNNQPAKPTSALFPLRAATQVASITTTADKNARPEALMQKPGVIQGGPPPNVPTNVMGRKEVPLPSQEGKQGVLQYAL